MKLPFPGKPWTQVRSLSPYTVIVNGVLACPKPPAGSGAGYSASCPRPLLVRLEHLPSFAAQLLYLCQPGLELRPSEDKVHLCRRKQSKFCIIWVTTKPNDHGDPTRKSRDFQASPFHHWCRTQHKKRICTVKSQESF